MRKALVRKALEYLDTLYLLDKCIKYPNIGSIPSESLKWFFIKPATKRGA